MRPPDSEEPLDVARDLCAATAFAFSLGGLPSPRSSSIRRQGSWSCGRCSVGESNSTRVNELRDPDPPQKPAPKAPRD
jgi:hypothetical protein